MSQIVTAIFENGLLRPLKPLDLSERQTVRIQVLPDNPADEASEIVLLLIDAGLMRPHARANIAPPDPVSAVERRDLAATLGHAPGQPLSEILISERGDW